MPKLLLLRRLVSCALAVSVIFIHSPSIAFATTPYALLPTPIVIGEVAWAGSSLSSADEWLELWNASETPVSLDGWSLRGASETPLLFPSDATIEPHGVFLISNYAASDTKSVLATAPQFVTTAVSLSNSALIIELLDETGAVIDAAGTGNAPPAGASLPIKISMIRSGDSWIDATSSQNRKPDVTDLGTPGICDGCAQAVNDQVLPPADGTPPSSEIVNQGGGAMTNDQIANDIPTNVATTTVTEVTTTSTADVVDSPIETATTTAMDVATSTPPVDSDPLPPTSLPAYSPPASPPPVEKPKPNYGMLRLNEVAPHPKSGSEWIEIVTLDAGQSINLRGCQIHDAAGRILTIGSRAIDPATSRYEVVKLSSARLNDGGDSVALYAPDGRLLDVMRYGATPKGASWVRFPDLGGDWQITASSTPNAANALVSAVASTTPDVTPAQAGDQDQALDSRLRGNDSDHATTSTDDASEFTTSTRELAALSADEARDARTLEREAQRDEQEQLRLEKEADREAKASRPAKRARSSATAKPITPITFDMLTLDELGGVRVRLTGRVGSPAGLLSNHSFILQSPDGRGLLVKVSSKRRLPAFGSDVAVVGSLKLDDRGIASLHELTNDAWSPIPSSTETVTPRIVDLLAPSAEDAWSFVNVTGTVTRVSGANVMLDLGDAEATVVVKSVVKYRAKRLVAGDVIAVTGLLDTSRDDARILPRTADDIVLLKHAPPKTDANAAGALGPTVPSWTPLGAAAGAVAATEGAKHWHRRRKMRKLEKKAKTPER